MNKRLVGSWQAAGELLACATIAVLLCCWLLSTASPWNRICEMFNQRIVPGCCFRFNSFDFPRIVKDSSSLQGVVKLTCTLRRSQSGFSKTNASKIKHLSFYVSQICRLSNDLLQNRGIEICRHQKRTKQTERCRARIFKMEAGYVSTCDILRMQHPDIQSACRE